MSEVKDLFATDFPHGTPEGYRRGCKSAASCSGVYENGISCEKAFKRYQGDYSFRAAVDAGMSPAQIVAAEEADTSTQMPMRQSAKFRKSEPNDGRVHAAPTVTVADSVEPFVDEQPELVTGVAEGADLSEQPADVDDVKAAAIAHAEHLGIDYEKHGTTKGYYAGCREKEKCPGLERVGMSCNQAVNEYQKEMKQRRAVEADVAAPKGPKPTPPATPAAAAVEAETERRVDDVLEETHEANRELAEAQQTLGEVREQAASYLDLLGTRDESIRVLRDQLLTRDKTIAGLRDEVAESERLRDELGHQLTALTLDSAERSTTTLSPAGRELASVTVDTPPVRPLGISIEPTAEGGVSVQLQGGAEPVYLDLTFDHGQLVRAGVNTGN